jgi:hypothetical protein
VKAAALGGTEEGNGEIAMGTRRHGVNMGGK